MSKPLKVIAEELEGNVVDLFADFTHDETTVQPTAVLFRAMSPAAVVTELTAALIDGVWTAELPLTAPGLWYVEITSPPPHKSLDEGVVRALPRRIPAVTP